MGEESGSSVHILFDSRRLDLLAVNGVTSIQVDGVHGELQLSPDQEVLGVPFEEGVVHPLHKDTEVHVVEPAGTKCPSTFGSAQGT
jgi:hypothetical protein